MHFFAIIVLFSSLAVASPVNVGRAVTSSKSISSTPLLVVSVGVSSSTPLGVKASSSTLLAVKLGSTAKSSSVSTVKAISTAISSVQAVPTTITSAPTSVTASPTALPSTFSAPVQGVGKLSIDNLPAMPAVIDKTFSGAIGTAYGLMSGTCNSNYKCSITVAGNLQSLLVDSSNYGTATSVTAWCANGSCYGSANPTVNATAPFTITCDQLTGTQECSGTVAGSVDALFTNGEQVVAWGWLTPAGYCQSGVCTASIKAYGDPMY